MKTKKYGLLIIVLFLILLYLFTNKKELTNTTISIGQTASEISAEDSKIKSTIKTVPKTSQELEKQEIVTVKVDPEMSFTTAFRNYSFFLNCKYVVEKINNQEDPMAIYARKKETLRYHQFIGGEEHKLHFKQFFKKCASFLDKDSESFSRASYRLKITYQAIATKNELEEELKQFLKHGDKLQDINQQINSLRQGVSSLSKNELTNLQNKIKQLYQINSDLTKSINSANSEKHHRQIEINTEEIKRTRNHINDYIIVDNESIKELSKKRRTMFNQIQEKLKYYQSPDIYAYLFKTQLDWFSSSLSTEYRNLYATISQDVFSKLGDRLKIKQYQHKLAKWAFPLFICALDYPCNDQSDFILYQCIRRANKNACGRTVEDFYLNSLISPNIQADVDAYINVLFENYAQEK